MITSDGLSSYRCQPVRGASLHFVSCSFFSYFIAKVNTRALTCQPCRKQLCACTLRNRYDCCHTDSPKSPQQNKNVQGVSCCWGQKVPRVDARANTFMCWQTGGTDAKSFTLDLSSDFCLFFSLSFSLFSHQHVIVYDFWSFVKGGSEEVTGWCCVGGRG